MESTVVDSIAVRLADEGVPLRAIARAVNVPSDEIRTTLHAAVDNGTLLDFPKEDWPPGFPRDQRALQLSRMVKEDRNAVTLALRQIFKLSLSEVSILLVLLQAVTVSKDRLGGTHRAVDVHVCHIRSRLRPFGISITTLWGYGYQLSVDGRQKIIDMILPSTIEVAA